MGTAGARVPEVGEAELIANLYGFYATWALRFPFGHILPEPEVVLIDSGLVNTELNIAFLQRPETAHAGVERAARFFAHRARPWRLEAPVDYQTELDGSAVRAGLADRRLRPGLVVTRTDLIEDGVPSDLVIRRVSSLEEAEVFNRTLVRGMAGAHALHLPSPARLSLPGLHCYLGLVEGEPVATAVLYTSRRVAGIYAVATVEGARRRGYGRAVTERAVADGFDHGCTVSFLQSSVIGRSVYEGMGYRWVFDRVCWATPEPGRSNAPEPWLP